jgi:hypothetical protein
MRHLRAWIHRTAGPASIHALMNGPAWTDEPNLIELTLSVRPISQRAQFKFSGSLTDLVNEMTKRFPNDKNAIIHLEALTPADIAPFLDALERAGFSAAVDEQGVEATP